MRLNHVKHIAIALLLTVVLVFGAFAYAQDEDRPYMGIRLAPAIQNLRYVSEIMEVVSPIQAHRS